MKTQNTRKTVMTRSLKSKFDKNRTRAVLTPLEMYKAMNGKMPASILDEDFEETKYEFEELRGYLDLEDFEVDLYEHQMMK